MVHEWALAEAVVATAAQLAGGRSVRAVRVLLGELQGANVEALKFALEELSKGTPLEGARVELEVELAEFECEVCNCKWKLSEVELSQGEREAIHFIPELARAFARCPSCNSPDFKVVRGRGVKLGSLEL